MTSSFAPPASRNMRVAMLSMHTSPLDRLGVGDGGGLNVYVNEMSQALAESGVEVDVYTSSHGDDESVVDLRSGVRIHNLDIGVAAEKNQLVTLTSRFAKEVRERIEKSGGVDLVHSHYWLSGVAGHILKHDLSVPLVSTFHTLARVKSNSGIYGDPAEREEEEIRVMGCSDAIVVSNAIEAAELHAHYEVPESRVHTVLPGVDHNLFTRGASSVARQLLGIGDNRPVLLTAGRIQRIKGLHWALDVVSALRDEHPDVLLIIVGGPSGSDGDRTLHDLQLRVAEESMEQNVSFAGPQPRELMPHYFRAADVCLMPSYSESFGLVALEASACGTPVVASAVGGLKFVVRDGLTGYLIERGDTNAYAHAVSQLLDSPCETWRMGHRAAIWARNFSWNDSAERLHSLYRDLTGEMDRVPVTCLSA